MKNDAIERGAEISADGQYRYLLTRRWAPKEAGTVCWLMLNPSTADASQDDNTIRRCMTFSESWGYDAMCVVNLFAFRATAPAGMKIALDPVGPENDAAILAATIKSAITVAAWGNHGKFRNRAGEVRQLLMYHKIPLYCLERTAGRTGQPKHPLYLKGDLSPTGMDR